eukprot:gnl/MRDRNA2_/MRDRNA2_103026_c0_seq1.p1 gnl/MRDRNA2_/MRDRNA2_103026_c0~~gnl/MRDRNA2_/MRDRNA2_103026_c0_seq1.p1  ORF type:complete len:173 (+),score=15.51 gnl/MRDRNA2_/MRDRNA2_103026_c0_seq1:70-588(+)
MGRWSLNAMLAKFTDSKKSQSPLGSKDNPVVVVAPSSRRFDRIKDQSVISDKQFPGGIRIVPKVKSPDQNSLYAKRLARKRSGSDVSDASTRASDDSSSCTSEPGTALTPTINLNDSECPSVAPYKSPIGLPHRRSDEGQCYAGIMDAVSYVSPRLAFMYGTATSLTNVPAF